ncbi:MAG: amylo-alpha-1,6-glucosidase [Ignavibacteriales bacterium]
MSRDSQGAFPGAESLVMGDLDADSRREWVAANGIGGWASSTVAGVNTRRYHGLLIAALHPPAGRVLLLSQLEDAVITGSREFRLSSNFYPGVVHPGGYYLLTGFDMEPFPRFTYRLDDVNGLVITREIIPIHGRNAVLIMYRAAGPRVPLTLTVAPLVNNRDYHWVTHRPGWSLMQRTVTSGGRLDGVWVFPPWEGRAIFLSAGSGAGERAGYAAAGVWYRDMQYPRERERGLEFQEDHFCPGMFSMTLTASAPCWFWASTGGDGGPRARPAEEIREAEVEGLYRRTRPPAFLAGATAAGRDTAFETSLLRAADSFIVRPGDEAEHGDDSPVQASIVAGYHWFEEWGRDAFVALPGICLATGRYDDARRVMRHFVDYIQDGMIPNRIPRPGLQAEYNSADASLWFIYALWKYVQYTSDLDFASEMLEVAIDIVESYLRGTRFGIGASANGMLWQGEGGEQLTWMDARIGDRVVTPRTGWAVEMNGLWYNALLTVQSLSRILQRRASHGDRYGQIAASMKKVFDWLMWDAERGAAFDVRGPDGPDRRLRPNQLVCTYLPFPLLTGDMARSVVAAVMSELYTPVGIRTLSPRDDDYTGRYSGGPAERDASYHQGAAWAWLTGPLITSVRRVEGYSEESRRLAGRLLAPFKAHLREAGLGTISELAGGDPPHEPGGCISQAWSVAEIFRAYVEEYLEAAPRNLQRGISG